MQSTEQARWAPEQREQQPRLVTPRGFDAETPIDVILDTPAARRALAPLGPRVELLRRPASFVVRSLDEAEDRITRVLILPPNGCTANTRTELNPHPEVRRARITVMGALRPGKRGFSRIRDVVRFARFTRRSVPIVDNVPNATCDPTNPDYLEVLKSSGETFLVVTESGDGFYHNLLNVSSDWVLLVLEKQLRSGKNMDLAIPLRSLAPGLRRDCESLIDAVMKRGDEIFQDSSLLRIVDALVEHRPNVVLPVLIEGLNVAETGKHEACSLYAIIMKIGRRHPSTTLAHLTEALERNYAPHYYLVELIAKIRAKSYTRQAIAS